MGQFDAFISHVVGSWGYYAVFGMLAAEGFGLFFIPGETTLLAAALVAGATHHLGIVFVLLAGYAGALLGDNFSYFVGHRFGFGLIRRYGPYVRLNQKRIKFVQVLYLRFGIPIVFVGRFIMLLRSWESFLAGANRMPWRRFVLSSAIGISLWATAFGVGGYTFGVQFARLARSWWIFSGPSGWAIFGIGAVIVISILTIFVGRHEAQWTAKAERALPGPLRVR